MIIILIIEKNKLKKELSNICDYISRIEFRGYITGLIEK
jgi:hypothetical protein